MRRLSKNLIAFIAGIALVGVLAVSMGQTTGGFPSRPRFQSVGIAASAPTGTGGLDVQRLGVGIGGAPAGGGEIAAAGTITAFGNPSIVALSTINPGVELNMADAGADSGRWHIKTNGTSLRMRALNDAGTTINSFLEVARTGAVINSVNLLGTAILANGVALARGTVSQSAPSGAGMLVGDTIRVSKLADESRASNITLTLDTHLQVTALPAGHYQASASLIFTNGAGGSRAGVNVAGISLTGVAQCAASSPTGAIISDGGGSLCTTSPHFLTVTGSTPKAFAGGTLGITWRQNSADVANSTLESDSWFELTRIN